MPDLPEKPREQPPAPVPVFPKASRSLGAAESHNNPITTGSSFSTIRRP